MMVMAQMTTINGIIIPIINAESVSSSVFVEGVAVGVGVGIFFLHPQISLPLGSM